MTTTTLSRKELLWERLIKLNDHEKSCILPYIFGWLGNIATLEKPFDELEFIRLFETAFKDITGKSND